METILQTAMNAVSEARPQLAEIFDYTEDRMVGIMAQRQFATMLNYIAEHGDVITDEVLRNLVADYPRIYETMAISDLYTKLQMLVRSQTEAVEPTLVEEPAEAQAEAVIVEEAVPFHLDEAVPTATVTLEAPTSSLTQDVPEKRRRGRPKGTTTTTEKPSMGRFEELVSELITRYTALEKENQELKEQLTQAQQGSSVSDELFDRLQSLIQGDA